MGEYVARAVACFAFKRVEVLLDSPIARVLERILGISTSIIGFASKPGTAVCQKLNPRFPVCSDRFKLDFEIVITLRPLSIVF